MLYSIFHCLSNCYFMYLIVSDSMAGMRLSESGTSDGKVCRCVIVLVTCVLSSW